ncbi:MAG: hypothetical protein ACREF1_14025, partial [Acetobacteraceae bacterium]
MIEGAVDLTPFRAPVPGTQPNNNAPEYGSTHKRHPKQAPIAIPHTLTEITGPCFSPAHYPLLADLSVTDGHAAMGERIIVRG